MPSLTFGELKELIALIFGLAGITAIVVSFALELIHAIFRD